jgi:hypothetical protein
LFLGPHPHINPSGNFRWGHCAGYPWGLKFWVAPWLYKLFYKHYIIKIITIIEKLINPIVIPQKHDNYTRNVLTELEMGRGGRGVVGEDKGDYKNCFRSQKLRLI